MDIADEETFIPKCADDLKPLVGKVFRTLDDAVEFYNNYSRISGFDVGLSTSIKVDDRVTWRYMLCSREGDKHIEVKRGGSTLKRRKRSSMRCGCSARAVFRYVTDVGYVVHSFFEEHNHPLIEQQFKHFMKLNRNIDFLHQKFILDCARTNISPTQSHKLLMEFLGGHDGVGCSTLDVRNISPTQSHKLLMEFLGGHDGVGCSTLDVRNYARDMNAFLDGADAQMLLNELGRKKDICPLFTFDYVLDKEDRLQRLFWCDSVSKQNYQFFGDVVAFDTTYSTNKYCMIFAPFTGKDNHGRPMTFGSGLLSKEDSDSFCWLFERFISCLGAAPRMIITDQDLGMKVAVERVLVGTRHRWCMWHIMLKLADKVSKELHANENFKEDLKSYVWSDIIEPDQFEEGWHHIMLNYGLVDDKWFKTMFDCRDYWVPAFFRDFSSSGLMRIASVSECENHFFKSFTRPRSNLLQFLMNYNHAIEAQRNSNAHLNYLDSSLVRKIKTELFVEKQAYLVYTSKIFADIQEELLGASFHCRIFDRIALGNGKVYKIMDERNDIFSVVCDRDDESFACDCNMFIRIGLLCRHVYTMFKNEGVKYIPDKYVVSRWKMTSLLNLEFKVQAREISNSDVDESKLIEGRILRSVINCIGKIDGDKVMLEALLSGIKKLDENIIGCDESGLKKKMFENYYGASIPEKIEVLPPIIVKTKGSGTRICSNKEKAVKRLENVCKMQEAGKS